MLLTDAELQALKLAAKASIGDTYVFPLQQHQRDAGIVEPFHHNELETTLRTLLRAGHRVALCEEV